MSKIFFTSDTHFGHANIIKYCNRPFLTDADAKALKENGGTWDDCDWKISTSAVEMMNNKLIDNINNMVGEDDILWHLGDWAFAQKHNYRSKCQLYRNRIKCKNVNIVWGNHDCPDEIYDIFNESHMLHQIRVSNKTNIVLCHYKLCIWNKSHRGNWHLYGHSHSGAENWSSQHMPESRSFDCGVDNAFKILGEYRPFSLEEVERIMTKKNGHSIDHH